MSVMVTRPDVYGLGSLFANLGDPVLLVDYSPPGAGRIRDEIGHWQKIRRLLDECDPYTRRVVVLYGGGSPLLPPRPVPWDWYRRDSLWRDGTADDRWSAPDDRWLDGCWWTTAAAHNASVFDGGCGDRKPGSGWPRSGDPHAPEGSGHNFACRCLRCVPVTLEGARDDLRRFVGGIIAALSLMLVRVLAALSRRIRTVNLVLLLIAAYRRFGHRDEPGDDALLARRSQSLLPGAVPAM